MPRDIRPRRVCFLLRSLERGGAERQVVVLASNLQSLGWETTVITFYSGGALSRELEQAGVKVRDLGKRSRWHTLGFLFQFVKLVRSIRPDVIQSILTVPNIVTGLLGPAIGKTAVVWGIRTSEMDLSQFDGFARFASWLERCLSWIPKLIICNSAAGRDISIARGFPSNRVRVIVNGIDTQMFVRDESARKRLHAEWKIMTGTAVIGIMARLDPMKGHNTLIEAVARLTERGNPLRLVCAGGGDERILRDLKRLSCELKVDEKILWLGSRTDLPAVYSAFDVCVSASIGEGFSNSIAESMACEVIPVVTAVGDSAAIVGEIGWVVPPNDSKILAEAIEKAISLLSKSDAGDVGRRARARIVERFSISSLVAASAAAFASVLESGDR